MSRRPADDPARLAAQLLALELERVRLLGRCRLDGIDETAQPALAANRDARLRLLEEARAGGMKPPGLAALDRFGLSPFELDVLYLAVGTRLDPRIRELVRKASRDETTLTSEIALSLLASTTSAQLELSDQLDRRGRLFAAGLLRQPVGAGLDAELIVTRRATAALRGHNLSDDLPSWAAIGGAPARAFPSAIDPARVAAAIGAPGGGYALVLGPPGTGKSTFAAMVATRLGARYLAIDVRAALRAHGPRDLHAELVEIVEDAAVLGLPLVVDRAEPLLASEELALALAEAIERAGIPAVVVGQASDTTPIVPGLADRATLRVGLRPLRGALATEAWRLHAGAENAGSTAPSDDLELTARGAERAAILGRRLGLGADAAIHAIGRDATDLLQPARVQLRLSDLVLSPETHDQLLELIAAIWARPTVLETWGMAQKLSRGRGISALFDGEPGTGKTMAAEVVARELELPLHRVNVSALVDKYIGETEKNLARVFAQARAEHSVLLFDEADALFGTRTEVKGANDRYANLEINVLLQLMEEHSGIVLLTTNLKRNIDQAFLRRISYKIEFSLPDEALRGRLWEGMLPVSGRAPDVNLRALARAFPLSGGDIKSACVRAAYRAAAQDRLVGTSDLAECAQLECEAMGRVVSWPHATH